MMDECIHKDEFNNCCLYIHTSKCTIHCIRYRKKENLSNVRRRKVVQK